MDTYKGSFKEPQKTISNFAHVRRAKKLKKKSISACHRVRDFVQISGVVTGIIWTIRSVTCPLFFKHLELLTHCKEYISGVQNYNSISSKTLFKRYGEIMFSIILLNRPCCARTCHVLGVSTAHSMFWHNTVEIYLYIDHADSRTQICQQTDDSYQ